MSAEQALLMWVETYHAGDYDAAIEEMETLACGGTIDRLDEVTS